MAKGDSRDIADLFILLGLGVVGYMAYNQWYKGQPLESVFQDIDSKVKSFLDTITPQILAAIPPPPQIQAPQPIQMPPPTTPSLTGGQDEPMPVAEPVSYSPTTNTTPPAVKEAPQLPASATTGNVSIIGAAGDWQSSSGVKAVAAAMEQNNVQFVIALGDYNSGGIQSAMGSKYAGRMIGAEGNHDSGGDVSIFKGQDSFNFAKRINSTVSAVVMTNSISESELDSLTASVKAPIIIYAMHMPCVTGSGDHHKASENKACGAIKSVAAKHGVKLILNGHNHYYGRFQQGGITYCTVGTAGGDFRSGDGQGTIKTVTNKYGFLKMTVQSTGLLCQFVSASDNQVLDQFTIQASAQQQYSRIIPLITR